MTKQSFNEALKESDRRRLKALYNRLLAEEQAAHQAYKEQREAEDRSCGSLERRARFEAEYGDSEV